MESLPFGDNTFDEGLAINSMQVCPCCDAGLTELRRVLKPAAKIALGFTTYSGPPDRRLAEIPTAAGFTEATAVETGRSFCALALKPRWIV